MIQFVNATMAHGEVILDNLREAEKRTIEKLKMNAAELPDKAINNEYPSFTLLIDGEPAAIFGGSSETMLGESRLWMLTTPLILKHQIPLLRASRAFVRWMFENYGPMIGMVDSEFEESKRWLQWIGFKETQLGDYIVMRYS